MLMERMHRRGAEFSRVVKDLVLARANGVCEAPGCDTPHNGLFDHITSCFLAHSMATRAVPVDRQALRSVYNCQLLCNIHDAEKTFILEPAALESLLHTSRGGARLSA